MSRTATDAPGRRLEFCTFRVDHLRIGVELTQVQEVIRRHDTTRVPLAPPEIGGLINLRGQIVTTIDVRRWLGLPPSDGDRMTAVVRLGEEVVGLLIDEADEVVRPSDEDWESVPPTAPTLFHELFTGTYKLDSSLLLVLDLGALRRIGVGARTGHDD